MTKEKSGRLGIILLILLAAAAIASSVFCVYLMYGGKEQADPRLVLYEGPASLKDATADDLTVTSEQGRDFALMHCTDTQVSVNGFDTYVYDTNVNNSHSWSSDYLPPISRTPVTYFDFEGRAQIEITVPEAELQTAAVSPAGCGIAPKVDKQAHTITFTIDEPGFYTVEINGKVKRAIHIFANPIEENAPKKGDENVLYVKPGEWNIENITLEDGQTLYISGGAVVHGIVRGNGAKDIAVKGRGIIDGSNIASWMGKTAFAPVDFIKCDGITVEGILLLNSNAWVLNSNESSNAVVDNVKIISSRPNGDGITLQSCTGYEVKNSFVRSWDDSLVVKNYSSNSENISFKNMTLWTDLAQSMEVGYETNKGNSPDSKITDITFEDITVLHNFHKPVISVHNADDALVSGITFRNITVEDARMGAGDAGDNNQLIDIAIVQNGNWSTTKERGQIRDVTIEGVKVLTGNLPPSRIVGFDSTHTVENVFISGLEILGKNITSFEDGLFEINEKTTKNIVIE